MRESWDESLIIDDYKVMDNACGSVYCLGSWGFGFGFSQGHVLPYDRSMMRPEMHERNRTVSV
jgi:hypothetical protein